MWQLILSSLKPGAKQVAYAEGTIILVIVLFAWNQHEQMSLAKKNLETAQFSLAHPKTVELVRYVKVAGPVRTITKIVEKPSGEREVTVDSLMSGSEVTVGTDKSSTPVPVKDIQPAPSLVRTNRYVLGLSNRNLGFGRVLNYGIWGGYSWLNRLDLLVGVTYSDRVDGNALVLLRF